MPIAVGIDLVAHEEIAEALRRGDRYLRRIYTDEELDDCGTNPRLLAACFAAKEATMKALSRTDQPIPWRAIELRMRRGSQPSLELTGAAASLADHRGVTRLSVSVTHSSHSAAAVVLASTGDMP
ncbi:MAG TPA: 4'-phosphopantetheinyl transferase superfamily protein [Solirubrobacteraceae bacterium]|nr:4'-phosphopantetheinyl transferase superfamily protein [Solirubrobacteraceae bacterium]